jgi:hypothetical protein
VVSHYHQNLLKINFITGTLLLILTLISGKVYSQNSFDQLDQVYGLNPVLYSGFNYQSQQTPTTIGHPFLNDGFKKGSLLIDTHNYEDCLLNIDIYRQILVFQFTSSASEVKQIEIPFYKTSSFTIDQDSFLILPEDSVSFQIFQVIGEAPYCFLLQHRKKRLEKSSLGSINYRYTKAYFDLYIFDQKSNLISIRNKKNLLHILPDHQQEKLKRWLSENHMKIKRANQKQLSLISQYLNQL